MTAEVLDSSSVLDESFTTEAEATIVGYFCPPNESPTDLFEKMAWASTLQGDGPLDGYTGFSPHNHRTQMGLLEEFSLEACWEEDVVRSALNLFHSWWKDRTGHRDNEPIKPIVHKAVNF